MDIISSNSLYMLERSMDFLWAKQSTILDNISNIETPGYKAKYVTFEEDLRTRLQAASHNRAPAQAYRSALDNVSPTLQEASGESARMDGNSVNATEQAVELARNAYQLQFAMNAISTDLNIMRTAIRGQ